MTNAQKLAEEIHQVLCKHNHTDGCSWFYFTWENMDETRKRYLKKAEEILETISYEKALHYTEILGRCR